MLFENCIILPLGNTDGQGTKMGWNVLWRFETDAEPENCALLGYYAASSGDVLSTFRDNLSVPFSGVKNPKKTGPISCTETSARNTTNGCIMRQKSAVLIYFAAEDWNHSDVVIVLTIKDVPKSQRRCDLWAYSEYISSWIK
jgi:hypothetical protein